MFLNFDVFDHPPRFSTSSLWVQKSTHLWAKWRTPWALGLGLMFLLLQQLQQRQNASTHRGPTPISLYKKVGFPRQTLPFSYVVEARAKTGSAFLWPFSYFWWVLYRSGSDSLCQFSYTHGCTSGAYFTVRLPFMHTCMLFWHGLPSARPLPPARHCLAAVCLLPAPPAHLRSPRPTARGQSAEGTAGGRAAQAAGRRQQGSAGQAAVGGRTADRARKAYKCA